MAVHRLPSPEHASPVRAEIERTFPGMRVPRAGPFLRIARAELAQGTVFELETSQKELQWAPATSVRPKLDLLLTLRGEARLLHAGRETHLRNERFVFVDGTRPFELSVSDDSAHVLLQLPLDVARLVDGFTPDSLARASFADDVGDRHLAGALRSLAGSAPSMSPYQRAIAEQALIGMLPLASALRRGPPSTSPWIGRAFEVLEARAFEPSFDADALAQALGVSRRYLDRLFAQAQTTASHEIWKRRLRRAADDLRSPRSTHRTILDIALSAGFSGAAHFSRAFRRQFGCSPSEWRRRGVVAT